MLSALTILVKIQSPSDSSGEWLWYVQGAMDIIQGTHLDQQIDLSDISSLVDWAHYHDALSRFVMHHWRHRSVASSSKDGFDSEQRTMQYPPLVKDRPVFSFKRSIDALLLPY